MGFLSTCNFCPNTLSIIQFSSYRSCHFTRIISKGKSFNGKYLSKQVKHTRVYIQDSSLISPHPVLLFGGDIEVQHRQQVVSVDKWLRFQVRFKRASKVC